VQDLSYVLKNPVFAFNNLCFSVQIFTFENVYTLDEALCHVTEMEESCIIRALGLTWAGGQEHVAGTVEIRAERASSKTTFHINAQSATAIRSVKLVIHNMTDGNVINLRENPAKAIPAEGLLLHYPEGWRNLYTPLVIVQNEDGYIYYRSLDNRVRDKKFAFVRRAQSLDVELIFEALATETSNCIEVPTWEVGATDDPHLLMNAQQAHVAAAYGLTRWEDRADVPAWMHKVSLVAAIHC